MNLREEDVKQTLTHTHPQPQGWFPGLRPNHLYLSETLERLYFALIV